MRGESDPAPDPAPACVTLHPPTRIPPPLTAA
jgi:hypothetical protein